MNQFIKITLFFAFFGVLVIGVTGVDLISYRNGFGMLLVGVALVILAVSLLIGQSQVSKPLLVSISVLGGVYFVIRAFMGGPLGLALPDIVLVLIFLGAYLITVSNQASVRSVIFGALAVVCAGNVVVVLMQHFGANSFYVWKLGEVGPVRVSGFFNHYNYLAAFLNGSLFLFLSYLFFGRHALVRLASGLLCVGMFASVLLSGSRGGWLSLMLGSGAWAILVIIRMHQVGSKKTGVAVIGAVVVAGVGLTTTPWMIKKLTKDRGDFVESGEVIEKQVKVRDGGRLGFQQMAFEIFKDSPLIGMGARAFSYQALEKWDPEDRWIGENRPFYAHNEYLQSLSDYGIVGFGVILILLVWHFGVGILTLSSGGHDDGAGFMWAIGAIGGLVAMLTQSLFSFLFHFPSCMVLAGLLLGLLVSSSHVAPLGRGKLVWSKLFGLVTITVAIPLILLGWLYSQSFLLKEKADEILSGANTEAEYVKAFDLLSLAGRKTNDPQIFEHLGKLRAQRAFIAFENRNVELGKKFSLEAKEAFEEALNLNPYSGDAITELPILEQTLGNWDEAEKGFEYAIKVLWKREKFQKVHLNAARASYDNGLRVYEGQGFEVALPYFKRAEELLLKRKELVGNLANAASEKAMRTKASALVAFYEGRLLFRKGDGIWRNAKPRQPELAYAWMLEAQKKYKLAEAEMLGVDPQWLKEYEQLVRNLKTLESGLIQPAVLTVDQIRSALISEPVLDSGPTSR